MTSIAPDPADEEFQACCSSDGPVIQHLAQEVRRLRAGIRRNQSQTGHPLCWLNDVELWRLLPVYKTVTGKN